LYLQDTAYYLKDSRPILHNTAAIWTSRAEPNV